MPFQSDAQRRFLYAKHPEIAKEFAAHTPKGKDLPEKKLPTGTGNGPLSKVPSPKPLRKHASMPKLGKHAGEYTNAAARKLRRSGY